MKFEKIEFDSIYFDIYELADGIYATIFNQDLGFSSNAGFFDLGNLSIIFDTLMDPWATKDLIRANKAITKKEPSLLVNSHYHLDHVFGNRLFSKSIPILSGPGTLDQFDKGLRQAFNQLKNTAPSQLKNTEELLQKEKNPKKIIEYKNDILTYTEVQDLNFTLRPPDLLLYDKMIINGSTRSVEIINVGNAHAYDDLVAYFPEEKACFMGDLLFSKLDPDWANGINGNPWSTNPEHLKDVMNFYLEKDLDVYIPGHGTLCSKKEVNNIVAFLDKHFIKN